MRFVRRSLALLAALAALLAGSLAMARGPRIVIVGPSAGHPTVARVRDELSVLGAEVEVRVQGTDTIDLPALARERGAAAAARVEEWPPEIIVWVSPESAGKAGQGGGGHGGGGHGGGGHAGNGAEIRVSESLVGPIEPALLALRAIELLRGRLILVPSAGNAADHAADTADPPRAETRSQDTGSQAATGASAKQPAGSTASPGAPADASRAGTTAPRRSPPGQAARSASDGRFSGFAAAAVALDPGGMPALPQIQVGGRARLLPRFGVEVMALLPTTAGTLSMPEGVIDLQTFVLGAGFDAILTDPAAPLRATASLGAGAMLLLFEGDASPPFVSGGGSRWAALPYAGVGMSYRLSRVFAVRVGATTAIALPEPVVRANGREVVSVARPVVYLSLGIEVRP